MLVRICAAVLLVLVTGATAQVNDTNDASESLTQRYNGYMASTMRRRHFYCLPADKTISNFPSFSPSSDTEARDPYVWAIFLQYPVLSYLDSQRKESLFVAIADIVNVGAESGSPLDGFSADEFCIARVYHYRVSDYEESVLVNIYFRMDSVVMSENGTGMVTIADFVNTFTRGFGIEENNANSMLVQRFEGRAALVVSVPDPRGNEPTQTETNQHPGVLSLEDPDDPTMRAVYLQAFNRPTTIDEALGSRLRPRAGNPNPTNFGLEPGDIVFAVFGSIFLAAVGALVLLGFCIHPFFLA